MRYWTLAHSHVVGLRGDARHYCRFLPCLIVYCCLWPFVIKMALNEDAELGFFNSRKVTRDGNYVFISAFFDDRLHSSHPSIRVLGYHRRTRTKPLFCRVLLHTGQSFCLQAPATAVPLEPSTTTNKTVIDHFYICRLAQWHRPVTVSLGISPSCDDDYERVILDVRFSSEAIGRIRPRSEFAVCLSEIISRRIIRSFNDVGRPGLVVTWVGCHTANFLFAGWRYPVGIYT